MNALPPLPPGFTLDQGAAGGGLPPIPPGFSLDQQQPPGAPPAAKPSLLSDAAKPITDLPDTYKSMVDEAVARFGKGVGELKSGQYMRGAADAGRGALDYATAPISAPLHTIVGEPTHSAVKYAGGSEKTADLAEQAAEFAASMALPIPKAVPRFAGAAETAGNVVPTIDELKSAAKAGFQHPEVDKLAIKAPAVQNWKDSVVTKLNQDGFDENVAPKTFAVLKSLDKAPAGAFVTGKNLQSLRKIFGRAAGTLEPTEKAAASQAIDSLDHFVANMPKDAVLRGNAAKVSSIWSDARANYAAAKRAEAVQEAVDKAKDVAGSTYSGMNIDNATRQKIRHILDTPKLARGFSDKELQQMRLIDRGTFKGNIPRWLGNFLFGSGWGGYVRGAAPLLAGLATGRTAEGIEAATIVPMIGYAFKKLGNAITAGRVADLDKLVRSRSPLAAQMRGPLTDYGKASMAFEASPTARNIARLAIASRNLSNNLKDAGIQVSPQQLVGGAQNKKNQQGVKITDVTPRVAMQ